MKVELISLLIAACLALVAALPIESDAAEGSPREERSKKESVKLRLMEAIANSRPSPSNTKEKQSTVAQPVKEETKVTISKSENIAVSKATAPKSEDTAAKLERQRLIADQALRERLRQTVKVKEHAAPEEAAHSAPGAGKADPGTPQPGAVDVPPVVYVPMSGAHLGDTALRFAPYVPAIRLQQGFATPTKRISWPFSNYFPIIINDPFVTITGGYGGLIEYGPSADVCKPTRDATGHRHPEDTEISMEGGGYKMIVRGGGVAIAGPGGVATAGRGGTAIVGPGGVVYTMPGGLAVVGPGGRVLARRKGVEGSEVDAKLGGVAEDFEDGIVVARGPVVYYDSSEDEK